MIRPAHSTTHSTAEGVADHLSYASCPIHLSAPILTRFKKPACAPLERAKELVSYFHFLVLQPKPPKKPCLKFSFGL